METIDLKSIALFLLKKGLSSKEVMDEINTVLECKAIAYSTVTKYKREMSSIRFQKSDTDDDKIDIESPLIPIIQSVLTDNPYSSTRMIARHTGIPQSTVYRTLTMKMGFVFKHLNWVHHTLNIDKKNHVCQYVMIC